MTRALAASRAWAGRGLRLLAALAVALTPVSCSQAPRDPVEQLLAALEQAVEARDAEAFAELLAPDFHAKGALDRAGAAAELRRLFALYDSVSVERAPAEVTRQAGGARVMIVVRVLFSAKPKLEGRFGLVAADSQPVRFELRCRSESGVLRVAEVDWAEESPAPPAQ